MSTRGSVAGLQPNGKQRPLVGDSCALPDAALSGAVEAADFGGIPVLAVMMRGHASCGTPARRVKVS